MDAFLDFLGRLPTFALIWLPLIFFAAVVYLLWRMVALMPRVKPTEVDPDSKSAITWEDIAGVDEAAKELQEVVDFLQNPRRFGSLGARVPKGILLYGPPGTGKTLLAKAVAHASGATFYSQSASAFVEMFAGLGAARIRKLFDKARKNEPSIGTASSTFGSSSRAASTSRRSAPSRSGAFRSTPTASAPRSSAARTTSPATW